MNDTVNPFGQPGGQTPTTSPTSPTSPSPTPASPFGQSAANQAGFGAAHTLTTPPQKSHNKLIIGIIGGVLAVAAIVVVVVLILGMGKPSVDDYDQAYDATVDLSSTISDVVGDIDFNEDDATQDDMKAMADQVIAAVDTGQGEIDELGKMKAVANDEKAKQLFDAFNSKYGELSKTVKGLMNNFKQITPVMEAMLEISNISYSDRDDYAMMASIYQKLADTASGTTIDNADLKGAVDNIAKASSAYASYFQQAANGQYPDYDTISDASDLYYDAQDTLSDIFSTSDLYDLGNDVDDAQRDLADYLWGKYDELDK